MLRKWDIKDEKIRKQCLEEVIARIEEEDDTTIGIISAQEIVDIVAKFVGPNAYNMAIVDSKKIIDTKLGDLEIDFDLMKVSV
jgi:uncharacterized protein (DUF2164 family)